jgi:hypothetical protein
MFGSFAYLQKVLIALVTSVVLSAFIARNLVECDIEDFMMCRKTPNLLKIGKKLKALYMKFYLHFIVTGEIKPPYSAFFK